MSSCEFFRVLERLSLGEKPFVVVSVTTNSGHFRDVVVDGRPLLSKLSGEIMPVVEEALRSGRASKVIRDVQVEAELVYPRPSIVVVGSGMVAKALVKLASAMGWFVAAVGNGDLDEQEMQGASFVSNSVETLKSLVSVNSIVVIANEGGKPYDSEATYVALKARARFVGLMASKRRAAAVMAKVVNRGISLEELKSLRSPVGLDIGSVTAEEIALSILSQIVKEIRGGTGRPLMEIKDPYVILNEALRGEIAEQCSFMPISLSQSSSQ